MSCKLAKTLDFPSTVQIPSMRLNWHHLGDDTGVSLQPLRCCLKTPNPLLGPSYSLLTCTQTGMMLIPILQRKSRLSINLRLSVALSPRSFFNRCFVKALVHVLRCWSALGLGVCRIYWWPLPDFHSYWNRTHWGIFFFFFFTPLCSFKWLFLCCNASADWLTTCSLSLLGC